MGTGNYRHNMGKTVMIDLFDEIDLEDEDADFHRDMARETFEEELRAALPSKAWHWQGSTWRRDDRDCRIMAQNAYHQIWLHVDSYDHFFVTFGVREDVPDHLAGIAEHTFETRAIPFFDALQAEYPEHTYVATSAWTSARRETGTLPGLWGGGGFLR